MGILQKLLTFKASETTPSPSTTSGRIRSIDPHSPNTAACYIDQCNNWQAYPHQDTQILLTLFKQFILSNSVYTA